jgi:hypothetical protein
MKKYITIPALLCVVFWSCAPAVKPMYYWGDYDKYSYKLVKGNEEADMKALMEVYADITNNAEAKSVKGIPPGVCADYGFFLLRQGKAAEGKQWLDREKMLFPESGILIDRILKIMAQ